MWRHCVAWLSLLAAVGAQHSDEERIAELEDELAELREASRGRVTCSANGGYVSIAPMEGSSVAGYTITNATYADDAGLMVLEVALSDQDTDIVLPGMIVRVTRAGDSTAEDSQSEASALKDLMADGMDIWGVIGGNLLTWLFGCTFIGVVAVLEKKYKCIGGHKLSEILEQHHELQTELQQVISAIRGGHNGEHGGGPEGEAVSVTARGADIAAGIGFAAGHGSDVGRGLGLTTELARAGRGNKSAKAMLGAAALKEAKQMEGMSPEEVMKKGKESVDKGAEMVHNVAGDERTVAAVAFGKQKIHQAVEKAKEGGPAVAEKAKEGKQGAETPKNGGKRGRFGNKGSKAQSGGMKAKPGGGFELTAKASKPKSGSSSSGTKFQNPMLGRVSMSNPMRRSESKESGESLLNSELTMAEEGED